MTFRLLQLPQVALIDVISQYDPQELVYLSLCSRNMQTLAKLHKKIKCDIIVDTVNKQDISIRTAKNGQPKKILSVRSVPFKGARAANTKRNIYVNGEKVPFANISRDRYVATYWEDTAFGLKKSVQHVLGLFGTKQIQMVSVNSTSLWFLDWIFMRGFTCERCETEKRDNVAREQFGVFLSKYESVNKFHLRIRPEPFYRYEGPLPSYPTLILRSDPWLTLDSLKTLNSRDFIVLWCHLRVDIINQFVKHWLTGAMRRLQFMSIGKKTMNLRKFSEGFQDRLVEVHEQRKYKRYGGEEHTFGFSHDLTRDDGVVITFAAVPAENERNNLLFMIWPDSIGRTHRQHVRAIEED